MPSLRLLTIPLSHYCEKARWALQKTLLRAPHSNIMRSGFALVFFVLAVSGRPPFFYLTAAIVGLGVVSSTLAYLSERSADKPAMLRKPLGEHA